MEYTPQGARLLLALREYSDEGKKAAFAMIGLIAEEMNAVITVAYANDVIDENQANAIIAAINKRLSENRGDLERFLNAS